MLVLTPQIIGEPNWREYTPGELTDALAQWYDPVKKKWVNVPWFESDRFFARISAPNYRKPITFRAKVEAVWAAKWKIFRRYVLKQKTIK